MENINVSNSPLRIKKAEISKTKQNIALITGVLFLVRNITSFSNAVFQSLISTHRFNTNPELPNYIMGLIPVLFANLLTFIPNLLFALYLIVFYKKNPGHGSVKAYCLITSISYVIAIINNVFGLVAYADLSPVYSDIILNNNIALCSAILNLIAMIGLSAAAFSNFKNYKTVRFFQGLTVATYVITNVIRMIYISDYFSDIITNLSMISSAIIMVIITIFWFVCIDADTYKIIKEKKKSVPRPVYRQPVYQTPVQPIAKPVNPAVQNKYPTANLYNEEELKILKIRNLLDKGLITQEEYDQKKAEIIEKI